MASLLLATVVPAVAQGHAAFLDSTPEPGTRLEAGPGEITLSFTEPLNRPLSEASLVNTATGDEVPAQIAAGGEREIVLRPQVRVGKAAYRVDWHTVSTLDGHALEGSFSFGVRTAASTTEHTVEQSPLARDGWLRIGFRALLYASMFFFAGGVFAAALLSRRGDPAAWLVPAAVQSSLERVGESGPALAARLWRRTLNVGWLAVASAVAVAFVEALDASGGIDPGSLSDFLLSNLAGLARVATVIAIAIAAWLAARMQIAASAWMALAFLAIAISGHASSADPRLPAVATDWIHLVAAAVWIGGIAQIAAAWVPALGRAGSELRMAVMRGVLPRFGRLALPAFLIVVASGLTNALIQLGRPGALWETAYGRVLALKIALVALIAGASYAHAIRLRPRLLAANPRPPARLERRHWRLLSIEPALAIGVMGAVAALVAFPLPPRQLGETEEARAEALCDPCPLPKPGAGELAVAEQAGSRIAAFWLRREDGRVSGTVRLLDLDGKPVDAPASTEDGELEGCGLGCWRLSPPLGGERVAVSFEEEGERYEAAVPSRWLTTENGEARRTLRAAQRAMRDARTVRMSEQVTSGPGTFVSGAYRFQAPDRMAYTVSSGARVVVVGDRQYRRLGNGRWKMDSFGGAGGFRLRELFRWTVYASSVRLLGGGRRSLTLALFDPATPIWYRLDVDRRTNRVLRERMIAAGHFMARRYSAFDRPLRIEPPR
jgi:copper transport protein